MSVQYVVEFRHPTTKPTSRCKKNKRVVLIVFTHVCLFVCFYVYSYAVGGPDVTRRVPDTRRSYGMESVEDDPFIVAASMQSMTSNDGKKKKQQDPSVNYGYLSQGKTRTLIRFHLL